MDTLYPPPTREPVSLYLERNKPVMHLVSSVTDDCKIDIGLRREAYGEVDHAQIATISPTEARVYASHLVRSAEIAERRARLKAACP